MIAVCASCRARYRLDAAKVPARLIRVRCPACAAVFELDGARQAEPISATVSDSLGTGRPLRPVEPAPGAPQKDGRSAPAGRAEPAGPAEHAFVSPSGGQDLKLEPAAAVLDRPGESPPAVDQMRHGRRRRRDKTEMLARALVSDILVYNQAARDKALANGTLLETLGPEIKKSWELYKEKVGAETAANSSFFKDALNEILADGQHVF